MEVFVMLSLMIAVASSASLDVDICADEKSWCQSFAVAEACGAVDHCKETVWKNLNLEECRELVGEEALLQIGDSELALRMICCSLGICNEDAILESREDLPLKMKQKDWSLSQGSPTGKCRECQEFFSSLQKLLKTSETQAFVQNVLRDEICPLMTGVSKNMCLLAVEAYLPLMLKLSLQFYDSTTICQKLVKCALMEDDFDQSEIGVDWNMLNSLLNNNPNKTFECQGCKAAIEKVILIMNGSEATMVLEKDLISFMCKDLCPFRILCTSLVEVITPRVISILVDHLISINICGHLRFCQNSSTSLSLDSPTVELDDASTVCQICEKAFTLTIESATVNKTEMTILNAMRMTCDSLWWPYVGYCRRMINAVGLPTVEMLSQRLHPRGACAMLGFCDGASNGGLVYDIVANVASKRCSYCQSIAGYLVVLLPQERTVNKMQSQVKRVCDLRPFGLDKEECESVVDKYASVVVQQLVDDLSQDNFCQSASLCTGLTSDVVSMTAIPPAIFELWPQFRCLYGPQFWCATRDNAKLCQLEEYCGS